MAAQKGVIAPHMKRRHAALALVTDWNVLGSRRVDGFKGARNPRGREILNLHQKQQDYTIGKVCVALQDLWSEVWENQGLIGDARLVCSDLFGEIVEKKLYSIAGESQVKLGKKAYYCGTEAGEMLLESDTVILLG